ncbi:MAG: trans-sulfuration enzyme family protein [Thermoanaerobaculia bacterium]
MHEEKRLETRLVHAGEPNPRPEGAVTIPIYQSVTYESMGGEASYHAIRYARLNNTPNHVAVHAKLAALENAEAALVTASGMAAISTALLAVLGKGDHLLAHKTLYGGTHDLLTHDFPALGIESDSIDAGDPDGWESKLKPNTKAIYVETLTNPLVELGDLEAVVAFARKHKLVSLIDNTFASPVNFRPPEHGFDLSLHSATKFLNGHSDVVAGAIIGRADLVETATRKLNHFGGTLDPHACFLLHRGLKTLALRVRCQNQSALEIARFFEHHPSVERVSYPGLPSHPHHERAVKLLDGFGGVLAVELRGGREAADNFMKRVTVGVNAPSLGGVETLLSRPAAMSHSGLTAEERAKVGVSEGLIRISIGIEATEDLIDDFARALA